MNGVWFRLDEVILLFFYSSSSSSSSTSCFFSSSATFLTAAAVSLLSPTCFLSSSCLSSAAAATITVRVSVSLSVLSCCSPVGPVSSSLSLSDLSPSRSRVNFVVTEKLPSTGAGACLGGGERLNLLLGWGRGERLRDRRGGGSLRRGEGGENERRFLNLYGPRSAGLLLLSLAGGRGLP
uniref:Uncharacterized protein n=1 Tax=Cacopsylla melanoneura TaxID=428564 RepID=A0A8D8LN31_9HEMI